MLVCVSLCQSVFVRDISLSDLSEVYAFVSVREMNVSVRGMCLCQSGVFLSLAVCVSRGYFCRGSLCQSGLSDCVRQRFVSMSVGGLFFFFFNF